jgi:transcription elongation GreA/GreB family factor
LPIKSEKSGKEMGKSCQEGAETFHDNFAYEDGKRQQYMLSGRIRELIRIRNQARVLLDPPRGDTVSIGRTVTVEDEHTGETRTIKIRSYMVLSKEGERG